ncbi:MAG TPA: contractile injection system protein, VgrG/Pvc8 family [Gemmatimonadaceae bacterium]|nr:contractile injection system protein, VgrG/Pvc8 family [Gemmatimonadaceae bacterium]
MGTSSSAFVASAPTINVAGEDKPELSAQLLELTVREDTLGLYRCEAEFGNWGTVNGRVGFRYFDRALLDFGKGFKVTLGSTVLFDGRVMGLRGAFPEGAPPRILVLADDRLQDLRMTRRTRTFADQSDSQVMQAIASDHSLTADVSVSGPTHKVLAQVNQSDLAFLRERARAVDAEVWVEGSTLHAKSRGSRSTGTVQLTWQNQLREFAVTADLAAQRTEVAVSGWDVAGKGAIKAQATSSAISSELNGDTSGVSILQGIAARKENLAHPVPVTANEGQAAADAFFRMSARRFVTGRGVAEASAGLRVGARVELKELGPLFSGKYTVTAVRHRFDTAHGVRTEFEVERPGIGQP